jgi:hypothetical protein
MCRATEEEAVQLRNLLKIYEEYSGQVINSEKSAVMFSPNTGEHQKSRMREILNIRRHEMKNIWGFQFQLEISD